MQSPIYTQDELVLEGHLNGDESHILLDFLPHVLEEKESQALALLRAPRRYGMSLCESLFSSVYLCGLSSHL